MSKAYLTIDDAPSENFEEKVEFLEGKNIPAIFFCEGRYIEKRMEKVVDAVEKGYIIGNHSYSHKKFSNLSIDEAKTEIEKTEKLIEEAYERADTERPESFFRFPYGEREEGKKKKKLQEVLKEKSFRKPVFEDITYEWWREKEQDKIDWFWTFDCMEYRIDDLNQILRRIQEEKPDKMKGITADSADIILIHDHSETHEKFQPIIKKLIESGVNFCSPLK